MALMVNLENLRIKLKSFKKEDIIISDHAEEQRIFRNIGEDEIKENIINPYRLEVAIQQKAEKRSLKMRSKYIHIQKMDGLIKRRYLKT